MMNSIPDLFAELQTLTGSELSEWRTLLKFAIQDSIMTIAKLETRDTDPATLKELAEQREVLARRMAYRDVVNAVRAERKAAL